MIICTDYDNILNNLTEKVLELYNSRMGKTLQMSDITTYHFSECLTKEDADGITSLFKEKSLWNSLTPLPGSQKNLRALVNQGHRVIIATATDPCNFEWKCQFINKYFSFIPIDNIIRVMDKSLIKCDIMLEDNIDNLTNNLCHRICFDYPWNRNKDKDFVYDIHRIHSWDEVNNIIKDIERKEKEWEKM